MTDAEKAYSAGDRGDPFPPDLVGHAREALFRRTWRGSVETVATPGKVRVVLRDALRAEQEEAAIDKLYGGAH